MGNGRLILVTGAAGLIGRRVAEMLIADGRPVLATDRIAHYDDGIEIEPADLTDVRALDGMVRRCPDGIIHCGAISGPMLGRDDPAGTIAINVQGTVNLLDCARQNGCRRFVYCSSVSAYGATPAGLSPVPPTAPLAAVDIYGTSKAAADILVRGYFGQHHLDAVAMRIGWVYGPRRRTRSLLHRLIRSALDHQPISIDRDGQYPVQLIHVDDVARGLIAAFDQPSLPAPAQTNELRNNATLPGSRRESNAYSLNIASSNRRHCRSDGERGKIDCLHELEQERWLDTACRRKSHTIVIQDQSRLGQCASVELQRFANLSEDGRAGTNGPRT